MSIIFEFELERTDLLSKYLFDQKNKGYVHKKTGRWHTAAEFIGKKLQPYIDDYFIRYIICLDESPPLDLEVLLLKYGDSLKYEGRQLFQVKDTEIVSIEAAEENKEVSVINAIDEDGQKYYIVQECCKSN